MYRSRADGRIAGIEVRAPDRAGLTLPGAGNGEALALLAGELGRRPAPRFETESSDVTPLAELLA